MSTLKERVKKALEIAPDGSFDGGHHKMWVIDQMVRALLDCPVVTESNDDYTYEVQGESKAYQKWVREFEEDENGDKVYSWDTGIAP